MVMPTDASVSYLTLRHTRKAWVLKTWKDVSVHFPNQKNSLAPTLWYASEFHRKQAIATYFDHNDNTEMFQNLSVWYLSLHLTTNHLYSATFLFNNYKQSHEILDSGPIALAQAMQDLGWLDSDVLDTWHEEDRVYLKGLLKGPIIETLEMEYYQWVNNLDVIM